MKVNNERLQIRISTYLADKMRECAKSMGMSSSAFMRRAIINYIRYVERMPLEKFGQYVNDPNLSSRIAEMIEIAKAPWVNKDNDDE